MAFPPPAPRMRPRHRALRLGFSLVELLTVIAIAGILAAIIVPVVGMARDSTRAVQCLGNLRQLQLANITYAAEHRGGYVPILFIDSENAGRRTFWYQNTGFLDYLPKDRTAGTTNVHKLSDTMQCPTARNIGNTLDFTYGANAHGRGGEWVAGLVRQIMAAEIQRPAQTMAFADGLDWQLYADGADGYEKEMELRSNSSSHIVAYRHGGQANLVYFDGHAVRLPVDAFINNDDGSVARLWINRE